MEEQKVRAIFDLANKMEKYDLMLRLKCEICGPILRGQDKTKYPKCKKHIDK